MSKHTPGPWKLKTVPTSVGICHMIGPFPGKQPALKERHACLYADYPSNGNPADDELEANARLIASAPAMLEALECLIVGACAVACPNPSERAVLQEAVDIARAAIKAAKGEA